MSTYNFRLSGYTISYVKKAAYDIEYNMHIQCRMYTTYEATTLYVLLDLLNRIRYDFHVTYDILQHDVVASVVATQTVHERFLIGEIEPDDRVETEQELGENILTDTCEFQFLSQASVTKHTLLLTQQDRWAS